MTPLICQELALQRDGRHFDFSFTLERPEVLAVLGPSGAGKSTLLDLLAGFAEPECGELSYQQENLLALAPHRRPFTTLFQSNNLFSHLDVRSNIALGLEPSLRLGKNQWQEVETMAHKLAIGGYLQKMPDELSGGEQQRVALARSLLRRRPFLLLDEPFSALDPSLRSSMLQLIRELAYEHSMGVLFITHQPDEARCIADRIALLQQGKVSFIGCVDELDNLENEEVARYLGRATQEKS
jgi:thiamine ABC transporter, ATP-binding protein